MDLHAEDSYAMFMYNTTHSIEERMLLSLKC